MAGAKRSAVSESLPVPGFVENERILCYHGVVIYEAKVLKAEYKDKKQQYLIHYAGWNKSWDEWVPEERMLKHNNVNLELQKKLKAKASKSKAAAREETPRGRKPQAPKTSPSENKGKPGRSSKRTASESSVSTMEPQSEGEVEEEKKKEVESKQPGTPIPSETESKRLTRNASTAPKSDRPGTSSTKTDSNEGEPRKKKARVEKTEFCPDAPNNLNEEPKLDIYFTFPDKIRFVLADDWFGIKKNRQLSKVPADTTIDMLLEHFVNSQTEDLDDVRELAQGLKDFFNAILFTQLLYKTERLQMHEFMVDKYSKDSEGNANYLSKLDSIPYSSIFGTTHLLRLFTKLNCCPGMTDLNEQEAARVKATMDKLLGFMIDEHLKYLNFEDLFENCHPEYHRRLVS